MLPTITNKDEYRALYMDNTAWRPAMEAILMMAPLRCLIICDPTIWQHSNTPFKSMCMTLVQAFS